MFQETNDGIILNVKVTPKASHTAIKGWKNGELEIRLAAVPEKGQANEELIRFLAYFFKIGKSKVELIQGQNSRHKRVCLIGISIGELEKALKKNEDREIKRK